MRDTPRHSVKVSQESCGMQERERERDIEKEGRRLSERMCLRSVSVVNRKRMSVACKVTNVMKYSIGQHQQRPPALFRHSLQAVKFLE